MSLEGMYRKAKRQIKKRDAELAKKGTTAGQEAIKQHEAMSKAQTAYMRLPDAAKWAAKNPENAAYDQDGNPVDFSHWLGHDK